MLASENLGLGAREKLGNHSTVDIGQSPLDSVVIKRQSLMVDSQQMQCGRVKVIAVRRILRGLEAYIIAASIPYATAHTTPCHPCGEGSWVMVATLLFALHEGLPSKLARADDQRRFQQSSLLEIFNQGRGACI